MIDALVGDHRHHVGAPFHLLVQSFQSNVGVFGLKSNIGLQHYRFRPSSGAGTVAGSRLNKGGPKLTGAEHTELPSAKHGMHPHQPANQARQRTEPPAHAVPAATGRLNRHRLSNRTTPTQGVNNEASRFAANRIGNHRPWCAAPRQSGACANFEIRAHHRPDAARRDLRWQPGYPQPRLSRIRHTLRPRRNV